MYKNTAAEFDLELDHLSLPPLVTSQLEVLGPLDWALPLSLALQALKTKDQLLGGLGLEKDREKGLSYL